MTTPVDVLIIGAGASGAAVAWSLAETKMHILCLEQGDWMKPSEYPSAGRDWEARQLSDFHYSPNRRARDTDYPINEDNSPIKIANFNGVGGGTVLYAGHFPRFHPSDFRVRTLDGVADDWPIDYATLEPFYAENDRMMGVSGLAGDPAYPPHEPDDAAAAAGQIRRDAGARAEQAWLALVAVRQRDRLGGLRRPREVHQPRALHLGLRAGRQGEHRHHLLARRHPRRRRAAHALPGARDHQQRARHGVRRGLLRCRWRRAVPAGRGGDPRLQRDRHGAHPAVSNSNGLANSSGLVGKNLMFHPYARIAGYFDETLDGYRGPGNCIWSQEFYETDRSRGFVRGYTFEFSRGQGPVMAAVHGMQIGRLPWGADHHRAYRRLFCHRTGMVAICEDLPEEHNTVTLDPVLKDSNGIPAPKINYTLSENSRRMLDHAVARASEILRAAGAHDVWSEAPLTDGGWHLMGTARMGTDPARSVVNEWGRSHDVKNLFIVDGSIFVTSAGVNPTRTIQALALYVADSIKQRLATLFD